MDYSSLSKEQLIELIKLQESLIEKQDLLIEKQNEKIDMLLAERRDLNLKCDSLVKTIEDKEIKLKKQLIDKFGIKTDKKEVIEINEAESLSTTKLGEKKQTKKRGRKPGVKDGNGFNPRFVEQQEIIVEPEDLKCECGDNFTYTGKDQIKYKIEITEPKIIVKKYIIKQYRCKSCLTKLEDEQINTFDNESFLTPSLGSYIVNMKYNFAIPLYRLESMFELMGLDLNRQLLANYCIKIAETLEPIYEALKTKLLNTKEKVLQADETTLKVIRKDEKERQNSYVWLYSTTDYDFPIRIYEYQDSRERKHPMKFLENFKGYLECDDYAGYNAIPNVKPCRCWFHAKKKYADLIKAIPNSQKENSELIKVHNMISNIFHEEEKFYKRHLSPNEIKKQREKILRPLVNNYFEYIKDLYENKVDKKSQFGEALKYSIKIEPDLCRFFESGFIPLSNNLSERSIKPFVILRKNSLFSYSKNGAEASTILMSIVQTAKLNLCNPEKYIKYVLENIDQTKINEIDKLLPFSDSIPQSIKYNNINQK